MSWELSRAKLRTGFATDCSSFIAPVAAPLRSFPQGSCSIVQERQAGFLMLDEE